MDRSLRTLLFSTLYPSPTRPGHGIFVETRLRELLKTGRVQTKVLAPVPWFPSSNPRFGAWAKMAATPRQAVHNGIEVRYPRYPLPPKIGMNVAPHLLALRSALAIRQWMREGLEFDVIDAHYYYPDGVAAAWLARYFDKPLTITARGSDLNLFPTFDWPRRLIQGAARQADASIGVCADLMERLHALGEPREKLNVFRNGVDLQRFRPLDQAQMRQELGLEGAPLMVSVGHLVPLKGHELCVEALARMLPQYPQARLVIIGEGAERPRIEAAIERLGLQGKVRLTGALPNVELLRWYSAADILLLASSREGWANVLLEAMACGTPVAATPVGGSPEVVSSDVAGRLIASRDAEGIAEAASQLWQAHPGREAVRRYAEGFSWDATSEQQIQLFRRLVDAHAARTPTRSTP